MLVLFIIFFDYITDRVEDIKGGIAKKIPTWSRSRKPERCCQISVGKETGDVFWNQRLIAIRCSL
jgi:hypothetical protein